MINFKETVVLGTDLQQAFGDAAESPALRSLRDSQHQEVGNAVAIGEAVVDAGGVLILTRDQHNDLGTVLPDGQIDNRSEDEFKKYGRHSTHGGPDAEFNPPVRRAIERIEAKVGPRTVIPVDQYDTAGRAGSQRIIEARKNHNDITKVVLLDGSVVPNVPFIEQIGALRDANIKNVVCTGKIIEVCVSLAIFSLLDLFPDLNFYVVADAVSALPEGVAEQIGLLSKEAVLTRLQELGVQVVYRRDLIPSAEFIAAGVTGA